MPESKARALLLGLVREGVLPASPDPPVGLEELGQTAAAQGLSGLLLSAVEGGRAPWAEPLREGLTADRRRRLARALRQIQLLTRAVALLSEAGIRTLPLKGAVLAETVYDIESDRPMSDVDLLALERWRDGLALLERSGYAVLSQGDHAWALREAASGELLELHRSVTSAPGLFPCDVGALWARRLPGRAQLAFRPSPEDLLLQLALHAAFQHGLVLSLVQWLDFRRVLEREAVDVERLRARAVESRALVP
ncbi:MAG TPA: nucleotidyltransferase family protein, partial [Vicinamibacteria bacterium]